MKKIDVANIRSEERGIVSIIVVFILMIVITMTVLGFSQVIRRSEQQALDAQLSSQALYAAEAGVNMAKKVLSAYPTTDVNKTDCDGNFAGIPVTIDYVINASTNTRVTCLFVDNHPGKLEYSLTPTTGSRAIPLKSQSGSAFNSLLIDWNPAPKASDNFAGSCNSLANTTDTAWTCPFGVVRVDLIPETALNGDRKNILASTMTVFIYPTKQAASSVALAGGANFFGGTANQGGKVSAACTASTCQTTITGLSEANYYARISMLYRPTRLGIEGQTVAGPAEFADAQIKVDSTGVAQDVLRRVQYFVPLTPTNEFPDYALESVDSLCKQFTTYPGTSYSNACL